MHLDLLKRSTFWNGGSLSDFFLWSLIHYGADSHKTNFLQSRNVIHGSDSIESATKEIALWFPEGLANWQSSQHPWIYEK